MAKLNVITSREFILTNMERLQMNNITSYGDVIDELRLDIHDILMAI